MNIEEIKHKIKKKEKTILEITQYYLDVIHQHDYLNAVIELNPDALEIAKNLDANPHNGALYGVPILIKDNISTHDKMATSTGSVALADNIASEDAPIITRLRNAGAVILGKTNQTEFSNYMSDSGMPNGYSSRGGQTISTLGAHLDPSGSSTGSAVAIAANMAPISIGTETCGSIISPAKNTGILGLKPTIGSVPNAGIIPISSTLDVAGPMAKSSEDLKILFEVIADQKLNIPKSLENISIGILRNIDPPVEVEKNIFYYEKVIEQLKDAGAKIIELDNHSIDASSLVSFLLHEFEPAINSYLKNYSTTQQNTLEKIIAYNEKNATVALKYDQDNLIYAREAFSHEDYNSTLKDTSKIQKETTRQLADYFKQNNVDIIFSFIFDYVTPCFAGNPTIAIPIEDKEDGEIPLSTFFIGKYNDEALLIKIAEILTS